MSRILGPKATVAALVLWAALAPPAWGQEEPVADAPPSTPPARMEAPEATATYPAPTTPEAAFEGFMAAMRAGDWEAYADRMHTEALAEFQSALSGLADVDESGEMARTLFGVEDPAELGDLTPEEFFARFMGTMSRMPRMAELFESASGSIIGSVPEGDLVHVVYRISMQLEGETISKVEVAPFRKEGDEWRALLTGSVQEMMQAFRAALGEGGATSP